MPELNDTTLDNSDIQDNDTSLDTEVIRTDKAPVDKLSKGAAELDAFDNGDDTDTRKDSKSKHTVKKSDDPDTKDTAKDHSEEEDIDDDLELPEEYQLTDEDGISQEDLDENPELAKNMTKAITKRLTAFDKVVKAKEAEFTTREEQLAKDEELVLEVLAEGLDLSGDKKEQLSAMIEKFPTVKELKDNYTKLSEAYYSLYAQHIVAATVKHLEDLGYSLEEADSLFTANKGETSNKLIELFGKGLSIEEAIRTLGITSKKRKLTIPKSVDGPSSSKGLTFEQKIAKYARELD